MTMQRQRFGLLGWLDPRTYFSVRPSVGSTCDQTKHSPHAKLHDQELFIILRLPLDLKNRSSHSSVDATHWAIC
jgi:hypothetical protein